MERLPGIPEFLSPRLRRVKEPAGALLVASKPWNRVTLRRWHPEKVFNTISYDNAVNPRLSRTLGFVGRSFVFGPRIRRRRNHH